MSAPFHVIEVKVAGRGRLWLRFADGASGELDVIDRLRGPVFEIARTEAGFAQAGTDPEGHTVCWPGGADLAPDVLHRAVTNGTDVATARDALTREMQARLDEIAAADAAA
jgi:hypothetical protein